MCIEEFIALTVFLRGASAAFRAYDPQQTGRITLDFNQYVYCCANTF